MSAWLDSLTTKF